MVCYSATTWESHDKLHLSVHPRYDDSTFHLLMSTDWWAHWVFLGWLVTLVGGECPFNSLVLSMRDLQLVYSTHNTKTKIFLLETKARWAVVHYNVILEMHGCSYNACCESRLFYILPIKQFKQSFWKSQTSALQFEDQFQMQTFYWSCLAYDRKT